MDAFAGSGSTLMVAGKLGRRWIGMDQSPQAVAAMRQNLAQVGLQSNWHHWEELPK
jgi:adenine-specific DNA-methyltransferase